MAVAAKLAIEHGDSGQAESGFGMNVAGIGPAIEQAEKALDSGGSLAPLAFAFKWRNMRIEVAVGEIDGGAQLTLCMGLGNLPYTAENADFRAQVRYLQIRREHLPLGAVEVDAQQSMRFVADLPLALPLSGGTIVTAVVQVLLRVTPYLPLLQARRAS